MPRIRYDAQGRNVTNLPGLWDEHDAVTIRRCRPVRTVAYGRYVRTRNGRKRRLTLHHVASQRKARGFHEAGSEAPTADWLLYAHSAWAGMSAVGPRAHTPCVLRRRNERINAMLEEWEK